MLGTHNNSEPLVSIIIPCYNADAYIKECVESCLSQTYSDFEIIIVDDGGSSATQNILKNIVISDEKSRIRVVSHPGRLNKGVLASRLLGFGYARGDYISLLDADDKYLPCRLERQIECFSRFPNVVLCHTGIKVIGDVANCLQHEYHFSTSPNRPYHLKNLPDFLRRLHICNSSVMFKADAIRGLSIPSQMLYQLEDWVIWVLLSKKGPFVQISDALTCYRFHEASFSHRNNSVLLQRQFSRIEFLLIIALYTFPSFCSVRASYLLARCILRAALFYTRNKALIEVGIG